MAAHIPKLATLGSCKNHVIDKGKEQSIYHVCSGNIITLQVFLTKMLYRADRTHANDHPVQALSRSTFAQDSKCHQVDDKTKCKHTTLLSQRSAHEGNLHNHNMSWHFCLHHSDILWSLRDTLARIQGTQDERPSLTRDDCKGVQQMNYTSDIRSLPTHRPCCVSDKTVPPITVLSKFSMCRVVYGIVLCRYETKLVHFIVCSSRVLKQVM